MFCRRRNPPEGIFWTPVWSCYELFWSGFGSVLDLCLGSSRPLRQRFHPLYSPVIAPGRRTVISPQPHPSKGRFLTMCFLHILARTQTFHEPVEPAEPDVTTEPLELELTCLPFRSKPLHNMVALARGTCTRALKPCLARVTPQIENAIFHVFLGVNRASREVFSQPNPRVFHRASREVFSQPRLEPASS